MLFAIGGRVRFKHTGYEGTVTELIDDQMVNVLLDDGDEIPAFVEDLMRIEDYRAQLRNKPPVKAKVVKGKTPPKAANRDYPEVQAQYSILRSLGVQLAFEAQYRIDGTTEKYRVYLLNDTSYNFLYTFELQLAESTKVKSNGKLDSVSYIELEPLFFDDLNDSPQVQVELWQVTTAGTGSKLTKQLKIKPKQFFKSIRTAPLLNLPVHHYVLFDKFEPPQKVEEDLQSYTRRNSRPSRKSHQSDSSSVLELASFEPEIDLHISRLVDDPKNMSNAEKLRLQLHHFDTFLEKAARVGVSRVYVIHGLGKGRLRNEIASRLINNPDVQTFKNEYHPRYGYGATEVIFNP